MSIHEDTEGYLLLLLSLLLSFIHLFIYSFISHIYILSSLFYFFLHLQRGIYIFFSSVFFLPWQQWRAIVTTLKRLTSYLFFLFIYLSLPLNLEREWKRAGFSSQHNTGGESRYGRVIKRLPNEFRIRAGRYIFLFLDIYYPNGRAV